MEWGKVLQTGDKSEGLFLSDTTRFQKNHHFCWKGSMFRMLVLLRVSLKIQMTMEYWVE